MKLRHWSAGVAGSCGRHGCPRPPDGLSSASSDPVDELHHTTQSLAAEPVTEVPWASEADAVMLPTVRTRPLDPAPELISLCVRRPLTRLHYPDGHLGWLVTSHALARAVLIDPRFRVKPSRPPVGDPRENALIADAAQNDRSRVGVIMALDPPEHTRLRHLQAPHFTSRRAREHRVELEQIVSDQLHVMEDLGPPADLVQAFALPVASAVICDVLGIPHDDRHSFERINATIEDPETSVDEKAKAIAEFSDYAYGLIARKRIQPTTDVLGELIAAGELTDDELAGIARMLVSAAHDTSATMLALSVFALLSERERWETLRTEPHAVPGAVDELLRYLTIVQLGAFTRTASEDVELEGIVIRAGEGVTVSLAAANRDPRRFAEPDRFHIHGDARGHVAFGYGRHVCLGQHLARLELEVGLTGLMRRIPSLRLAVAAEEVPLHSGKQFLYGVHRLPVTW